MTLFVLGLLAGAAVVALLLVHRKTISAEEEIKRSLDPIAEHLSRVSDEVGRLELDRRTTHGQMRQLFESMSAEVGRLRDETGTLVSALKRPQVRGAWGEMQLRNCVAAANMTEHVDFITQVSLSGADGARLRPDLVVHLPADREVVVDAKVPMDAYLRALDAGDEAEQQRLVALRIELELTEELVLTDPERGAARLRELEHDVDEALEELRALAHGVYPPVLADRGLAEALRAVALRSAIRVDLVTHGVGRYSTEVEAAAYFCVLEALQNVHKHANGARRVVVALDGEAAELRFSVRDDGAGAAAIDEGAGITNMRDRLSAVGGEIAITSKRRVGTVVRGRVPTR